MTVLIDRIIMAGRGFFVKIELDLQAITCPGVWLCPNGRVALRISTLNTRAESHRASPAFPLIYYDKFSFDKLFTGVNTLAELQESLENEYLYTELLQWSSINSSAVILATFETNLADLLYPAPCYKGLLAGSEVDLLMEPTKYFPGILAPKIEVSTRTTIEEVIGICDTGNINSHVINPKVINSKNTNCVHRKKPSKGIIRQRQVCHTQGKAKFQPNGTIRQRQSSTDGSSSLSSAPNQLNQSQMDHRYHRSKVLPKSCQHFNEVKHFSPHRHSSHRLDDCPVCSKYKFYFSENIEPLVVDNNCYNQRNSVQKIYESSKCLRNCCVDREKDADKVRPRSAPHCEHSLRDASASSLLRARNKEFLRKETRNSYVGGDACELDYFEGDRDQQRQGFYKSLEKFYKRMYKQAKIRAQEIDCA